MDHVGDMLVGDAEGLTVELGVQVHLNGTLRVLGVQVALLGFAEVATLQVELGLVHENLRDTFGVELSRNLKCRVPILFMLIHINGLLRLVGLDKLFLSLLKSVLILQVKRVLKVNLRELIFGMRVCQSKSLVELLLVGFEVDGGFDEAIFKKELSALLGAHVFSDLDGDFCQLFCSSVSLCHAKSFLPHVMSTIHVDTVVPGARFNVVVLGLLEVAFHF